MKTTLVSLISAFALGSVAFAGPSKTYQVTGPVLEVNDSVIAVQKGKERWEIARDASTKGDGQAKVGDKVTVTYTMTATAIEAKAAAKDAKAGAKGTSSPTPAGAKK